ncbi:MAG TPA: PA14 domain-containing protein, partial [Longimicrobiaceae bacterium]|nr:PA14 domain-containing protein [Longimicrobiaceae bacterium]
MNEVLESYVAAGEPLPNDTSGQATAEALSVNREHGEQLTPAVSEAAYKQLCGSVFPFSLPYDRHRETVRAYLGHLGSSGFEIAEALRDVLHDPPRRIDPPGGAEYLRLDPGLHAVWTETSGRPLHRLYGYSEDVFETVGLRAELYDNTDLSGEPVAWRVDPGVDFEWATGSPASVPAGDTFGIRWSGRLRTVEYPHGTPYYTFHALTDGGFRLRVDGETVIDAWFDQEATEHSSPMIPLDSLGVHDFQAEYYENGGYAIARLFWSVDTHLYHEPIPAEQFRCTLAWQEHLSQVPELLKRTGLTFTELLDLLGTRFVNPDPAAPRVRLVPLGGPAELDRMQVAGLTADGDAALRDIHRFVRLWRALGIPMRDLDRALAALGRDPAPFVERLSGALRVREALERRFGARVALPDVLVFWAPFDTHGADSPYEALFRNRAVWAPLDDDFELVGGEVRGTGALLDDKRVLLSAALRLPAAELAAGRADAGLGAPEATLSLAALSALQRRAVLARALRLGAADLATLRELTGIDPFASPEDALDFLERVREVREAGFSVAQLAYLFRDEAAPTAGLRPPAAAWMALVRTVRAGLARIAAETAPAPDPDAQRLRELLGAELGEGDAAVAMAVI